jgi:transcriptional regulator with XRE-family HTH domain
VSDDIIDVAMRTKIEPFYEALGSKIQQNRERRKMTQAQLGLSLLPPSTRASIANIESGKQRVLVHTLSQFATVLGVDIRELMPAATSPAQSPSRKDVERELGKKLKLAGPALKKLTARLSTGNSRGSV